MAKTPLRKKNARLRAAGLPEIQPPKLPFDVDHFVLNTMVKLHQAGDPRLPAGWVPPPVSCACGAAGPLHTCDRHWTGQEWVSLCPGCGQHLPTA